MRNPRDKIYADFLTNLSVAWMTAGIITPLFTKWQNVQQVLIMPAICFVGGYICLHYAVYFFAKYEL